MKRYCPTCKEFHESDAICPRYKQQLLNHPELLPGAANKVSSLSHLPLVAKPGVRSLFYSSSRIIQTLKNLGVIKNGFPWSMEVLLMAVLLLKERAHYEVPELR